MPPQTADVMPHRRGTRGYLSCRFLPGLPQAACTSRWLPLVTLGTLVLVEGTLHAPSNPKCAFPYSRCHPDCEPWLGAGLLHTPAPWTAAPGQWRLRPVSEKGTCLPLSLRAMKSSPGAHRLITLPSQNENRVQATQGSRDHPARPFS